MLSVLQTSDWWLVLHIVSLLAAGDTIRGRVRGGPLKAEVNPCYINTDAALELRTLRVLSQRRDLSDVHLRCKGSDAILRGPLPNRHRLRPLQPCTGTTTQKKEARVYP